MADLNAALQLFDATEGNLKKLLDLRGLPSVNVGNVLSEEKKKQVIALGQLGWTLRRIQRETGIRRETAAAYLKAAGVPVPPPGRPQAKASAKPAIMEVTTNGRF